MFCEDCVASMELSVIELQRNEARRTRDDSSEEFRELSRKLSYVKAMLHASNIHIDRLKERVKECEDRIEELENANKTSDMDEGSETSEMGKNNPSGDDVDSKPVVKEEVEVTVIN